jgi:hypothetical protein
MLNFLKNLTNGLETICPTFTHVPPQTPYPYITVEAEQVLQGLPWGPCMAMMTVKIWSRYMGLHEILTLVKDVEAFLQTQRGGLKILESKLVLLNDGQTRLHSLRLKARILGEGL